MVKRIEAYLRRHREEKINEKKNMQDKAKEEEEKKINDIVL